MYRRVAIQAIAGLLSLPLAATAGADRGIALVIGNSAYRKQPLRNPVNDARAVGQALRELGFDVQAVEDGNLRDMVGALQRFSIRAREHRARLIFYAGHGMQVRGRNYLIPVDADIATEDDVTRLSADVGDLLERLGELRDGVNIIILDACRNNPFNVQPALDADGRRIRTRAPSESGLAQVDAPKGTLVAYSTAPGTVAIDSGTQPNSVYTRHLLRHLRTAGLPVEMLFKRVRAGVALETQQLQVPWEASSLTGDFCFAVNPERGCGS